jgi:hypothetical protein
LVQYHKEPFSFYIEKGSFILALKSLCYGEWQEEGIRVVCVNIIFPIRGISVKNTNKYINTIK